MTPETQFKLGCLKTIIKTETGVDIMIRGCYGKEQGKKESSRYSDPNNFNNMCESPRPNFWKQLRDGPLANAKKPVDVTNAQLEVCLCSDADGCNGVMSTLLTLKKGGLLTLLSVMMVGVMAFIFVD